jgi:hypothetical protein
MAKAITTQPNTFRYGIVKIKTLAFYVNELMYLPDPLKQVKVEIAQLTGTNIEANLIDFRLRVFFYYLENKDNVLADINVQNVFFVEEIKQFVQGASLRLPSQLLISMVSLAISHSRALFAQNLAGTAFSDFMLPITNPIDAAKNFFPSTYNKETGAITEFASLDNLGIKVSDIKK